MITKIEEFKKNNVPDTLTVVKDNSVNYTRYFSFNDEVELEPTGFWEKKGNMNAIEFVKKYAAENGYETIELISTSNKRQYYDVKNWCKKYLK